MNQSTFESMSRVLLAFAVAVLAAVLAFGGNHDAVAQTRTVHCEQINSFKSLVETMDAMLGAGKREFIVSSPGMADVVCGW